MHRRILFRRCCCGRWLDNDLLMKRQVERYMRLVTVFHALMRHLLIVRMMLELVSNGCGDRRINRKSNNAPVSAPESIPHEIETHRLCPAGPETSSRSTRGSDDCLTRTLDALPSGWLILAEERACTRGSTTPRDWAFRWKIITRMRSGMGQVSTTRITCASGPARIWEVKLWILPRTRDSQARDNSEDGNGELLRLISWPLPFYASGTEGSPWALFLDWRRDNESEDFITKSSNPGVQIQHFLFFPLAEWSMIYN